MLVYQNDLFCSIDCDDDSLNAEARLLEAVELEIGHLSLGTFDEIFIKLTPPAGETSNKSSQHVYRSNNEKP